MGTVGHAVWAPVGGRRVCLACGGGGVIMNQRKDCGTLTWMGKPEKSAFVLPVTARTDE